MKFDEVGIDLKGTETINVLVKFLTLPLIVSGCLRVVRSLYAKSRILDPIQNSMDLIVFRISGLQHFHWILSCIRLRDCHLIRHNNLSMYLDVGGVVCLTPLS